MAHKQSLAQPVQDCSPKIVAARLERMRKPDVVPLAGIMQDGIVQLVWDQVTLMLVRAGAFSSKAKISSCCGRAPPNLGTVAAVALFQRRVAVDYIINQVSGQNRPNYYLFRPSTGRPLSTIKWWLRELQPSQIVTSEPDLSAPTAEPPAPLISVAEAEAQVGFGVAKLPFVPDGFDYLGAKLYGNAVNIEYATQGYGGHLSIMQSQEGFIQSEWDKVPAHAIVPVKIGELDGEFVRGTFVVYAGETSATWEPDAAILRLRWVKDGVWFAMTKHGDVQVIEYLDQAGMIELAESLAVEP